MDKTSVESLIHYGDLYYEAGAFSDALDFYAKAGHLAGLEKIKDYGFANGDAFLYQQAARFLGSQLQEADWEGVARKAMELGKFSFARRAVEKTNNPELLNTLKTQMKAEETKQSA